MNVRHRVFATCLAILLLLFVLPVDAVAQTVYTTCLDDALSSADDSTTVGELRALCAQEPTGDAADETEFDVPVYERNVLEERFATEREFEGRPFVITAFQPNYILASTMDSPNQAPFTDITGVPNPVEDNEMVFQVSIKAPIWRNVFNSNVDAYFAYTVRSWWQLFNDDLSAPFRETNYQPELFLRSFTNHELVGIKIVGWDLGFNHESNGRSDPLSRSWNRIIGRVGLQLTDDLHIVARAWYRIPEDEADDDNPHEYRYYGYGDGRAIWTPNRNTFTALVRPGTDEISYELTWSYPISSVFRIYAQYYNGFGESLLDYDYDIERIGIGIALNDFLGRY